MSRARIAALAVAIAMVGMPVAFSATAASAATSGSTAPAETASSEDAQTPEFGKADRDGDDGDHHAKGHHGEDSNGYIPPVVIRPHEDGDRNGDDNGAGDDDNGGSMGGGVIPGPIPTGAPTPIAVPSPGATAGPNASGAGFGRKNNFVVAPLNSGQNPPGSSPIGSNVQNIDPQSQPPIEMAGVHPDAKTPADLFMESATLGIVAMAVGALAFGGVAGVRAIRLRKDPHQDYFYDSK